MSINGNLLFLRSGLEFGRRPSLHLQLHSGLKANCELQFQRLEMTLSAKVH